jgi:hypothetical protein
VTGRREANGGEETSARRHVGAPANCATRDGDSAKHGTTTRALCSPVRLLPSLCRSSMDDAARSAWDADAAAAPTTSSTAATVLGATRSCSRRGRDSNRRAVISVVTAATLSTSPRPVVSHAWTSWPQRSGPQVQPLEPASACRRGRRRCESAARNDADAARFQSACSSAKSLLVHVPASCSWLAVALCAALMIAMRWRASWARVPSGALRLDSGRPGRVRTTAGRDRHDQCACNLQRRHRNDIRR